MIKGNYLLPYAIEMAEKYYTKENFEHALRVAGYIKENQMIQKEKLEFCEALAVMHDLVEDTEFYPTEFEGYMKESLLLLTRFPETSYIDYCSNIKKNAGKYPESYWVKLADMKDHLSQTETLTESLKKRYLQALPYLL